jgi:hypothetical protein
MSSQSASRALVTHIERPTFGKQKARKAPKKSTKPRKRNEKNTSLTKEHSCKLCVKQFKTVITLRNHLINTCKSDDFEGRFELLLATYHQFSTLDFIPTIEPDAALKGQTFPPVKIKPFTQFTIIRLVQQMPSDTLDMFIHDRKEICSAPDFPPTDILDICAYGFWDFIPAQAAFKHHLTCTKFYEHSGDTDVKTGYDCPMTHPAIYIAASIKHNADVGFLKTGITSQDGDVADRYSVLAQWMADYIHCYKGDVYLKFAIEEKYCRRMWQVCPPLERSTTCHIHTESVLVARVDDEVISEAAAGVMTDLKKLGLDGTDRTPPKPLASIADSAHELSIPNTTAARHLKEDLQQQQPNNTTAAAGQQQQQAPPEVVFAAGQQQQQQQAPPEVVFESKWKTSVKGHKSQVISWMEQELKRKSEREIVPAFATTSTNVYGTIKNSTVDGVNRWHDFDTTTLTKQQRVSNPLIWTKPWSESWTDHSFDTLFPY